jgi:outer membrane protein TolC
VPTESSIARAATFTAELGLAQAQLNELLSLVQLYDAPGGGWLDRAASGTAGL